MPTNVIMPVLGPSMEQGTVQQWLKREGETVRKDEPLLVVETDKATVEVPAPADGVLRRILVPAGASVAVTTPIAVITGPDEDNGSLSPTTAPAEPPSHGDLRRLRATPLARRLARELGLDLRAIQGTGPLGRIQERDVRAYAARQSTPPKLARAAEPEVAAPPLPDSTETIPLSRIRAITAERMAHSARSVARVTLFMETDFSEAARFRRQLAPEFERRWGARLTYDVMVAKACALALVEHPDFNSEWADGALRRHAEINIGLAVQAEQGLVVPVLRRVDHRPLQELAREANDLVERAKAGRSRPEDLAGSTFTITNLGAFGVDAFTPLVNPPEAAILGIGRIALRPAVVDGATVPRESAWLSLSFDHRVADGAPAAAFLRRIQEILEHPYLLLA